MALQVWLPLNGNVNNQGLSDLAFSVSSVTTINDNGKIGKCYENNSFTTGGLFSDKTIDLGQNQSMFCWFKINSLKSNSSLGGGLVTQHNHTLNQGMGITIRYVTATTGYLSVNTGNGTNRTYNTYYGKTLLQAGTWYHGGYTYDGTTIRLYVNGSLDGEFERSDMKIVPDNIQIFRWSLPTTSYSFNGCLNDVRIYDNVLSPREIKEISKGLVLHYPLAMPGGENLMPNSLQMQLGSADPSTGTWRIAGSSTMRKSRVQIDGITYGFQNEGIQTANDGSCYGIDSFPMSANTQYTISFDARIVNGTEGYAGFHIQQCTLDNGSHTKYEKNYYVTPLTTKWTRCWMTFTTNARTTRNIYIGIITGDTSVTTQMCRVKLELGSRATPWTPNPADDEYSAMGYDDGIEYDVSGYGNNGTKVGNITYNTDSPRYETSAYFNGSSDIRSAKNSFGWFDFNEGTVAAWYKPANTTQTWASVGVQNDGGAGSRSFSVCNYSGKAGTVVGYDSSWGYITSNYSMDANVWYHLCATITNGDTVKLYVNGELVQTRTVTNTTGTIASTTQFAVGVDLPGSDERYTGQLSDVRFYATCLSPGDVKILYNTPITLSNTGTLLTQGELSEV